MSESAPHGRVDALIYKVLSAALNGTGAVVAFFVISGFVLARSLDANPDPVRFVRNRVFRLFPAAAAVVALFAFLHWKFGIYVGYEGDFSPGNVILNMLLIKSDINGPMWSMTVECAATPLILFSVWLFERTRRAAVWAVIGVLFALSFWGPYVHLLGGVTNLAPLHAFVVGCLVHFRGEQVGGRDRPEADDAGRHVVDGRVLLSADREHQSDIVRCWNAWRRQLSSYCWFGSRLLRCSEPLDSPAGPVFRQPSPTASICCICWASASRFACWIRWSFTPPAWLISAVTVLATIGRSC